MKFIAATETGMQTGKVWMNDHNNKKSSLVNAGDVPEICGMGTKEFEENYHDIDDVNADTLPWKNFSFSENAEY